MATLWQKFKVQIPKLYNPSERESIAQDIIDFIYERTISGKDKNNRAFRPGYSKGYTSTREARVAGKKKGQTPNLKLSGDMLDSLGEYLTHKPGEIKIGYQNGSEENAKADGNIRGTYGHSEPITKGRDFLGIKETDLAKILKNYPIYGKNAEKTRFNSILSNVESKTAAIKLAAQTAKKYDIDLKELIGLVNDKFD